MRKLWSVARLKLRLTVGSPALLLMALGLPLLFTLLMGAILGGTSGGSRVYPVGIVDQDGSFASRALTAALQEEKDIRLVPSSQDGLRRLFVDRRIDSGLVIPAGFGESLDSGKAPELQIVAPPGGNLQAGVGPILTRAATRVAQDYQLALLAAGPAGDDATCSWPVWFERRSSRERSAPWWSPPPPCWAAFTGPWIWSATLCAASAT